MKLRTLVFSVLAVAGVIFWFQTNNGAKETDQPKTVAREWVKPIKLNQANGKPETKYAERKAAKHDLPGMGLKPTASTVTRMATVKQMPPAGKPTAPSFTEADSPERPAVGTAEAPKTVLPENWAEITQAAIAEPDPQLRGEAIQNLSLYGKTTEAIAVLTEVSVADPDPSNREKAVQALWNSAADNLDSMDDLKNQLEKSTADPDPIVADLATKAIADLERLAKRRGRGN